MFELRSRNAEPLMADGPIHGQFIYMNEWQIWNAQFRPHREGRIAGVYVGPPGTGEVCKAAPGGHIETDRTV